MVQNNQEYRLKYWVTCSSVCWFACTSLPCSWDSDWLNGYLFSVFFLFWTIVQFNVDFERWKAHLFLFVRPFCYSGHDLTGFNLTLPCLMESRGDCILTKARGMNTAVMRNIVLSISMVQNYSSWWQSSWPQPARKNKTCRFHDQKITTTLDFFIRARTCGLFSTSRGSM